MATLTAGELTNLRTTTHRATPYLSVFKPATLLGALVNNGSPTRGMRTIAYDNGTGTGYATIAAGQTLEVDTATGTRRVRIKAITGNQTAGTITVAENSIVWGNNQTLRVLHHYDLWGIPPRISGGIFYKDYDVIYSDQNSLPNPVAIAGPMRAGFLTAGTIAFTIDASPSYAITSGATIASYAWSCVHNGGGTTGITITNAAIATTTLTITVADSYWLKLIVTDSNGKTQTTYRLVFVYDANNPPYTDFNISSVSGDWSTGGYQFGISAVDGLSLADLPDRTPVLLWYANKFGSIAGFVNVWDTGDNILCAGYFRNDSDNDNLENGTAQADFTVTSADGVMDNIVELGSISINSGASVTRWYEYATWLTVGRGIHHLLKWHSTVLECVDVYGLTDNTTGVKVCDFTEPTLLQQANSLSYGRGIFAKLISDRPGRLHLVEDSQMLNTVNRAVLDTVCTLALADLSGVVTVARQTEERTATAELNGFSWDGSTGLPFIACLPGYIESTVSYLTPEPRGASSANINGQVLIDQTDANERVGRILAADNNNPQEVRITNPANYSGAFDIVPSVGFYEWGIADNVFGRALELNGLNLICRRVDNAVNVTSGVIQTSVVFEPEAIGPDGIPGNYPTGYPTPPFRIPPTEDEEGGGGGISTSTYSIVTYLDETDFFGYGRLITNSSLAMGAQVRVDSGDFEDNPHSGYTACLSATTAILFWQYGQTFYGKILEITGGNLVANAENALFTPTNTTPDVSAIDIIGLSATKALVAYHDYENGGAGDTAVRVLTISGTTITAGARVLITLTEPTHLSLSRLSSTRAFLAYDIGSLYGVSIDISGTTATVNSPSSINGASIAGMNQASINNQTAISFYGDVTDSYAPSVKAAYGIDTSFSVGPENEIVPADSLLNTDFNGQHTVNAIDLDKIIASYKDNNDFKQALVMAEYNGGGSLAGGNPLTINSQAGAYTRAVYPQIAAVSTQRAIVAYVDEDPDERLYIVGVTGNSALDITSEANDTIVSTNVVNASSRPMTIIAMRDLV